MPCAPLPGAAVCLVLATAAAAVPLDMDTTETLPLSQRSPSEPLVAPGRVLVQFRQTPAGAAAARAQARSPLLSGLQLRSLHGKYQGVSIPKGGGGAAGAAIAAAAAAKPAADVPGDALMLFAITDGSSVQDKVKALRQHPDVELAEPDFLYRRTGPTPNDPFFPPAPRYAGMWGLRQVAAPGGWATTTGSAAVQVCVIDTGARRTHQDLQANIAGGWNRWGGGGGGGGGAGGASVCVWSAFERAMPFQKQILLLTGTLRLRSW